VDEWDEDQDRVDETPLERGGGPAASERPGRPFRYLSDEQLTVETFSAEINVGAAERRIGQRLAVIAGWEAQAASLDQQAMSVVGERPAWTQVALDRQAEAAAAARLAALEETLGRGVVHNAMRGGPRGEERQQLQAESAQLRAARPEVAVGVDRSVMWARRSEMACADDKASYRGLRADAEDLRGKAEAARDSLPGLGDSRLVAEHRLDRLGDERRHRLGEPVAVRRNEAAPTIEGPGVTAAGPGVQAGPARQTAGSIDPGAPAQAQLDLDRSRSNQLAR